jgi:hypothetical protein
MTASKKSSPTAGRSRNRVAIWDERVGDSLRNAGEVGEDEFYPFLHIWPVPHLKGLTST